jgi:hypothetical protein
MTKPLSEFTGALDEKVTGQSDPPMMLVLRRKAIRQFPGTGDERVALYVNDALGIEISVPYKKGQIGGQKAVAQIKEQAHDVMYGEYLHHLAAGDHRAAEHIASKVERAHGFAAGKHFRTAGKMHAEGDVNKAAHHYDRFEHSMAEHTEFMLAEGMLHKLRHIARSKQHGDVSSKGAMIRVDPKDATKVLKLWAVLKPHHRKKLEKIINSGSGGIGQIVKFSDDHHKLSKSK